MVKCAQSEEFRQATSPQYASQSRTDRTSALSPHSSPLSAHPCACPRTPSTQRPHVLSGSCTCPEFPECRTTISAKAGIHSPPDCSHLKPGLYPELKLSRSVVECGPTFPRFIPIFQSHFSVPAGNLRPCPDAPKMIPINWNCDDLARRLYCLSIPPSNPGSPTAARRTDLGGGSSARNIGETRQRDSASP